MIKHNPNPIKYLPLVHKIAKKYYDNYDGFGYSDLFQAGCVGLMKAVKNYEPTKSAFTTHAYINIKGGIANYIKTNGKHKYISLDTPVNDEGSKTLLDTIPDDPPVDYENLMLQEKIKSVLNGLQDTHKDVIQYRFFDGLYLNEISEILGLSHQRVQKIEIEALKEIKKSLKLKRQELKQLAIKAGLISL